MGNRLLDVVFLFAKKKRCCFSSIFKVTIDEFSKLFPLEENSDLGQ